MNRVLEKQATEVILNLMEDLGEITTEAVMDLVRPHYIFDPHTAKEHEIRRKANRIMARFRDDQGISAYFSYRSNAGQFKYLDVDRTSDIEALKGVKAQLNNKYIGLTKVVKKVDARLLELAGQTKLFEAGS